MAMVSKPPQVNPNPVKKHMVIYTSAWGEEFEATVNRVNSLDERILYLKVPELGAGEIMTNCENVRGKIPSQTPLERKVLAARNEP